MRRVITTMVLAAMTAGSLALGSGAAGAATPQPTQATQASGIYLLGTDGTLSLRDERAPVLVKSRVKVTGLASGDTLAGLDTRPANGTLYALGRSGQLYTLDGRSGKATRVGSPVGLRGSAIGFDFNPTVDRIRVVTSSGQNLRIVPDTGALAATDKDLNYAPGDTAAGRTPSVTASGYTNSVAGATSTTLYGIDTARDTLVTQAPPNDGVLNTVGRLRFDVPSTNGFDVSPSGRAVTTVRLGGVTFLATVDLRSGSARPIAPVGGPVTGLTFAG